MAPARDGTPSPETTGGADRFRWCRFCLAAASAVLREPGRMVRLTQSWPGEDAFLCAPAEEVGDRLRLSVPAVAALCRAVARAGEEQRRLLEKLGVTAVVLSDPHYPPLLANIPQPPPLLLARGDVSTLSSRSVAIVGSRKATAYGKAVATAVSAAATGAGLAVVSGGALGIDGAAHEAATSTGSTIAVMGCGVDVVYPPRHRSLLESIARSGCVVSEFALGTPALAYNFPQRNRVIAGMAERVVVVEAGTRSGALITAGFAADYGREVFAVPGPIWAPQSAGCLGLLADGATPLVDPADVVRHFGLEPLARSRPALSDSERLVLEAVGSGHERIDALEEVVPLPSPCLMSALSSLELAGVLTREPGGRVVLTADSA